MIRTPIGVIGAAALISGGCTSMANAKSGPATLVESSAEVRAEITGVVSKALGGRKIQISENSLMKSDQLIIESRPAEFNGAVVMTRNAPPAEYFYLMMDGKQCSLWHKGSDKSYPLKTAVCVAKLPKG